MAVNAESQFHTLLRPCTANVGSIIIQIKARGMKLSLFQGPEFTQLLQVSLHRDHSEPAAVNSAWRA